MADHTVRDELEGGGTEQREPIRPAHAPLARRPGRPTLHAPAARTPLDPVLPAPTETRAARRDRRLVVAVSVAGLLLLAAGWFAYASHANQTSADEWKQRSIELDEQVNGLRTLIGERSAQLNERTRQANRIAANLRSTRAALHRSEGDVSSLARRQRELANDKAQLEDQRRALQQQAGALADIASRYISCKSSLIDVINALIDEDYTTASYEIDIANGRCDSAASALNEYVAEHE
jgi:chromosome segregation ATPase